MSNLILASNDRCCVCHCDLDGTQKPVGVCEECADVLAL